MIWIPCFLYEFSELEVKEAIFQMAPLSSPSPDGFLTQFYQTHSEAVGDDVCKFVLKFLKKGGSLKSVNDTYIILIPKIKKPKRVTKFKPISICNVLYKMVAKVLTNRLKQVLPVIISPNQSAFIPWRITTYNIHMTYETLHTLNTHNTKKKKKRHISKAYDRVEWSFLKTMMNKMRFDYRRISLIMECKFISSVSYSILINGEPQLRPLFHLQVAESKENFSHLTFLLCVLKL